MTPVEVHQKVKERCGEAIESFNEKALDPYIVVKADAIVEVCRFLKENPALAFDCLSNISALDYIKANKIKLSPPSLSHPPRHKIVVKVDVPRENPTMPSVEGIWKAANWQEREIYDLLGVILTGHPDLRRLLMPEDWVGHPLRKDFVEPEEYHGISTRRESLLK